MKETRESIGWDANIDNGNVGTYESGERMKGFLDTFDKSPLSFENQRQKENEFSESLKLYLRSLGYCARKKRHRCISQELGR